MSFSFSYVVKNKYSAREQINKIPAPGAVKAFIETAINNLQGDPVVVVKAHGHLMQTSSEYASSTANIEVYPIDLV